MPRPPLNCDHPIMKENEQHVNGEGVSAVLEDSEPMALLTPSVSMKSPRMPVGIKDSVAGLSHRPLTVFRVTRGVFCLFILFFTALVALLILAPVMFIVVRAFLFHRSRRWSSMMFGQWLAMWPFLFEKINGTRVFFSGDKVPSGERVMVMCNHRTEVDWMYIWNLALRKGRIGSCKYALKSSVRNVPIFGWAFHVMEFLPLDRKWELDKPVIESFLKSFQNPCDPFWFVLFPEGTDFTEEKLVKGNNYAKELGLSRDLHNVLLPRTRGFVACMPFVHRSLDAVYDLTMAYKYRCPLFIDNLFGIDPAEVHINIRRIPMEDIPVEEEGASAWLYDAFYQKDELLSKFKEVGSFPDPIDEGELDTRAFLFRLTIFTLGCYLCVRYVVMRYLWAQVYMASSFVVLTLITFFNYRPIPRELTDKKSI